MASTPARLLEELFAFSSGRWRGHSYPAAVHAVRCLVVDEADALLGGGFVSSVKRLVQLLDRAEAARANGLLPPGSPPSLEEPLVHREDEADAVEVLRPTAVPAEQAEASNDNENGVAAIPASPVVAPGSVRQYVFVAATLHASGRCTPGSTLRDGFPDAVWVEGHMLHRSAPQLRHTWVPLLFENDPHITEANRVEAVRSALHPLGRSLVFVNTGAAAERLAACLSDLSGGCAAFHAGLPSARKLRLIEDFIASDVRCLIATDAAARGLDIPRLESVVQAEFALSAIDFLHRVGRTARAGASGHVTSIYDPAASALVAAVRAAVERGASVEDAFSRKRSFTKKLHKYGESRVGTPNPVKAAAKKPPRVRNNFK